MTVNTRSVTEASEVCTETMGQEESTIECNTCVEDATSKNVETLAEDEKSLGLFTNVVKDEQSYIEEITILKKRLKKYDDIFDSVRKEADTEFDTAKSAFELCQKDNRANEQEFAKCQTNLYLAAVETIETHISHKNSYCDSKIFEPVIVKLSTAKVNLDNAEIELRISQDRLTVMKARYNAAKSRCDSDNLLAKTKADIELMLPISKLDIGTD